MDEWTEVPLCRRRSWCAPTHRRCPRRRGRPIATSSQAARERRSTSAPFVAACTQRGTGRRRPHGGVARPGGPDEGAAPGSRPPRHPEGRSPRRRDPHETSASTRPSTFLGALAATVLTGERLGWSDGLAMAVMAAGVALLLRERHGHGHTYETLDHAHAHVHDEHHRHAHGPRRPAGGAARARPPSRAACARPPARARRPPPPLTAPAGPFRGRPGPRGRSSVGASRGTSRPSQATGGG